MRKKPLAPVPLTDAFCAAKEACEIVATGNVWSDNPTAMVEEVHAEAATCVPAPTCTPKSGVNVAANEANCAAVSYTGTSGDGTVTTSVNQAQCEGILTADPSDGDATACEYTAAKEASACVAGSCSSTGCRATEAVAAVAYQPEVFPCQLPHGVDGDGNPIQPATDPGSWFNEKVEASSKAECETLPTGNTWHEDACPWVDTAAKDGNGHIRSGTGVAEACYEVYPPSLSNTDLETDGFRSSHNDVDDSDGTVTACALTAFVEDTLDANGNVDVPGNAGSCAVKTDAPCTCTTTVTGVTCLPPDAGACPTRGCVYTPTRCTYVPSIPLITLVLSNKQLTVLPDSFGLTMSVLKNLYLNHNSLQALPATFGNGMDSLVNLYLNNNLLDALPQTFGTGLVSLVNLNLNSNLLTSQALVDAQINFDASNNGAGVVTKLHLEVDTLVDSCVPTDPEAGDEAVCLAAIQRGVDDLGATTNAAACAAVDDGGTADDTSDDKCQFSLGLVSPNSATATEVCSNRASCTPDGSGTKTDAECATGFDPADAATCDSGCIFTDVDGAKEAICAGITKTPETCTPPTTGTCSGTCPGQGCLGGVWSFDNGAGDSGIIQITMNDCDVSGTVRGTGSVWSWTFTGADQLADSTGGVTGTITADGAGLPTGIAWSNSFTYTRTTDLCSEGYVQGTFLAPSTTCNEDYCTLAGTSVQSRENIASVSSTDSSITLAAAHAVVATQKVRLADASNTQTCAIATTTDLTVTGVAGNELTVDTAPTGDDATGCILKVYPLDSTSRTEETCLLTCQIDGNGLVLGYEQGSATAPSTTCSAGCILTPEVEKKQACEAQFVDNQCAYYALPAIMDALDATVSRTLVLAEREL